MDKKIETSKAYRMTNILLRDTIYGDWANFNIILKSGVDNMKNYLCDLWNSINEEELPEGFVLIDKDRVTKPEEFEVFADVAENGTMVFYFSFPDSDFAMAQAKCTALAFTPKMPRYFTMEVGQRVLTKEKYFVFGEWVIENQRFAHKNYGEIENGNIMEFARKIGEMIK